MARILLDSACVFAAVRRERVQTTITVFYFEPSLLSDLTCAVTGLCAVAVAEN